MKENNILEQINNKEDINILVKQLIENPDQIRTLILIIETEKKAIKYNCEKIIRLISEEKPELIYPYFNNFIKLLDIDNKFLKWGAIVIISNIVSVDKNNKFEKVFKKYYSLIKSPEMVTAANIIGNSWKIAKAKPELTDKIVDEIFKLKETQYMMKGEVSPECKKIVSGEAIITFEKIYDQSNRKEEILNFVKEQRNNTRLKIKKKAEIIYKKLTK